jgi:hypothetical protein
MKKLCICVLLPALVLAEALQRQDNMQKEHGSLNHNVKAQARHEDVWRIGGIANILNFGTRWWW